MFYSSTSCHRRLLQWDEKISKKKLKNNKKEKQIFSASQRNVGIEARQKKCFFVARVFKKKYSYIAPKKSRNYGKHPLFQRCLGNFENNWITNVHNHIKYLATDLKKKNIRK